MEAQAWFTLLVLALMIAGFLRERVGPDVVMLGGLFLLAGGGVLTPAETFAGFANEAVATIGALFVLSAALRETGAMEVTFGRLFGRIRSERSGLARMMVPVAASSAFLNNTAIVAMLTPVVIDWARRNGFSPARFLLPLSYATLLGGVITIIGTSTNLTVAGLVLNADMPPLGFFELAPAGIPICAAGLLYLLFAARWLPARREPLDAFGDNRREYTVTMLVAPRSPLAGKTVEEAGLRHLPGLFLFEIDRGGHAITPVAPAEPLQEGDRLLFIGVVETIVDLQRIRGLVPASDRDEPPPRVTGRRLAEAVVSSSSPLVRQSIRDAGFRTVYDAAVIAVHRNGEAVRGKIGDIVLRPGDTLLLQTAPGFARAHRNSSDFFLVSELPGTEAARFNRAWVSLAVLAAMVTVVTTGWMPMSIASFLAAGTLIVTRCISAGQARRSVDWPVLLLIAAALGVGTAMEKTGLATQLAVLLTPGAGSLGPWGPYVVLGIVYGATVLLTELLSNNAAAALMFPVAVAAAERLGVEPRGFVIAVTIAASCGFALPMGYQTHLIVYGPGGYRFSDFLRVGLPLDVLCGVIAVAVIPVFWPF